MFDNLYGQKLVDCECRDKIVEERWEDGVKGNIVANCQTLPLGDRFEDRSLLPQSKISFLLLQILHLAA